jgi:hypothetical protein
MVIITSTIEGRDAYGITVDSNENVNSPVSVSEALELDEFEEAVAILVPNDSAEPPLRAIKVRRDEG